MNEYLWWFTVQIGKLGDSSFEKERAEYSTILAAGQPLLDLVKDVQLSTLMIRVSAYAMDGYLVL